MLLDEVFLATAEIDDQPERQRQILTAREKGNRLWLAVVENLEVIFCEIGNQFPAGIPNCERDVHQADVHAYRVQFLGEAGGQNNEKGDHSAGHHTNIYAMTRH